MALIIASLILVIPMIASARGFVPCGGEGEPSCQFCHFVTMFENIFDWLIIVLSALMGVIISVAGYRLVVSGGNPAEKEAAKKMMTNAFIGFVIVLGAWLIVDFIMDSLADGSVEWNTIACVDQPYINPVRGVVYEPPVSCNGSCDEEVASCERKGGIATIIGNDPLSLAVDCAGISPSGANPPDLSAAGACEHDLVSRYFPGDTGDAQCIIREESTCGAGMVSGVDVLRSDGRAFSFGPMQINLTWHTLYGCGPGGTDLECHTAFNGKNRNATIVDEQLYQDCAVAAQDLDCGLRNGRIIRDAAGDWGDWSTAGACGL